jgi:hypothetical protein
MNSLRISSKGSAVNSAVRVARNGTPSVVSKSYPKTPEISFVDARRLLAEKRAMQAAGTSGTYARPTKTLSHISEENVYSWDHSVERHANPERFGSVMKALQESTTIPEPENIAIGGLLNVCDQTPHDLQKAHRQMSKLGLETKYTGHVKVADDFYHPPKKGGNDETPPTTFTQLEEHWHSQMEGLVPETQEFEAVDASLDFSRWEAHNKFL